MDFRRSVIEVSPLLDESNAEAVRNEAACIVARIAAIETGNRKRAALAALSDLSAVGPLLAAMRAVRDQEDEPVQAAIVTALIQIVKDSSIRTPEKRAIRSCLGELTGTSPRVKRNIDKLMMLLK